jgi:D-cysteine desulfhydrase
MLPYAIWQRRRAARREPPGTLVMPPGGAIPRGCLGFLSAGLELAQQVEQGALPPPEEVLISVGSTCSSAGLLVGLRVAARLGIGWGPGGAGLPGRRQRGGDGSLPRLVAVRVTPWPVTSPSRILNLARRVCLWLAELTGSPHFELSRAELASGLEVDGTQLGAGYGIPTAAGRAAMERLGPFASALDTTYSAKAAAALLARVSRRPAVRLFWSTKSSAPLPEVSPERLALAPARMLRWLERGPG